MHAPRTKILLAPIPKRLCIWAWKIRDRSHAGTRGTKERSEIQTRADDSTSADGTTSMRSSGVNSFRIPSDPPPPPIPTFYFTNGSHFRNSLIYYRPTELRFCADVRELLGFPSPPPSLLFLFLFLRRPVPKCSYQGECLPFLPSTTLRPPFFHVVRPNYRRSTTSFDEGQVILVVLRRVSFDRSGWIRGYRTFCCVFIK